MNDFLSISFIENKHITLNMKGLIGIIAIVVFAIGLIYFVKKLRAHLEKKTQKWIYLTRNTSKIMIFLIGASTIIAVAEVLGLRLTNYMSMELIKTENILVTPSRIIFIVVLLLIAWGINLSFKSIFINYVKGHSDTYFASMNVFKLVKYILWIIAIAIAMQTIGLNLTFVLAGSAALLVGVGIGMQKIFNDMISGLFLLFEHKLQINDVVEVDDIIGRVQDIGIRTSRIVTRDNIEMIIPNSKFINDSVINWSLNDAKIRFFVKIGVAYGSDVDLLKKILTDIAYSHPLILLQPAPFIFFRNFGDSSLDFEIAFWTAHSLDNEIIKSDLRFEINRKLAENNITIPFPQRDIHIINDKEK
jgi:small-conductance mechanosensitive channel